MADVAVPLDVLRRWGELLDKELADYSLEDLQNHHAARVAEELYDIVTEARQESTKPKAKPKRTGLTFHQIISGDAYEAFNIGGVKYSALNGKRVRVVQKNRTKVKVHLLEDTGSFKIGQSFTIPPACLREIEEEN